MSVQPQHTPNGGPRRHLRIITTTPPAANGLSLSVESPSVTYRLVRIAGEIDMLTAPDLRTCLANQLAAQPHRLMLDLTEVTFLGSTGLDALIDAKHTAYHQDTELYLTGLDSAVARLLHITGLAAMFSDGPPPAAPN